MYNNLVTQNYH